MVYTYQCVNVSSKNLTHQDTVFENSPIRVDSFKLEIVPPSTGIKFYRDGIVFLSNSKVEGKMLFNHVSFGITEAYYATLNYFTLSDPRVFSSSETFDFPCEALTFNKDYTLMYFTRLLNKKGPEKIFEARFQTGETGKKEWIISDKPLDFCTGKSVYTHPALSADGQMMIFSSDKPGSSGGMDLFITRMKGFNWTEPENLGNQINTGNNEMYPFLDTHNNLFFSSDGHKGIGGYDIYICRFNGKNWEKPENLTSLINSSDDELAFALNPADSKTAFFTSGNLSGNKKLQLFRVAFADQYAIHDLKNLSDAFIYLVSAGKVIEEIKVAESTISEPVIPKKTEPSIKPQSTAAVSEKISKAEPEKTVQKSVTAETLMTEKQPVRETDKEEDVIVYRIQFATSSKPKGSYKIVVNGQTYDTYEYFYAGSYRHCVGEFSTPGKAGTLKNVMRKEGHPDAFIATFRNNERILNIETKITDTSIPELTVEEKADTFITHQPAVEKTDKIIKTEAAEPVIKPEKEKIIQPGKQQAIQSEEDENIVIYRIQFSTSPKPIGSYKIELSGQTYNTYEYFYAGLYRYCIGEFSTLRQAVALKNTMRKEGYPDAFVAAFRNNERTLDPALFK